jgi:hypothetical protein
MSASVTVVPDPTGAPRRGATRAEVEGDGGS